MIYPSNMDEKVAKLHADYTNVIREKDKIIERQEERIGRLEKKNAELRKHAEAMVAGINKAITPHNAKRPLCSSCNESLSEILGDYQRFRDGGVGKR